MTNPSGKPPIDRAAPEAGTSPTALAAAPGDFPMPAIENAPASTFRPAAGVGSGDVLEIALMYLLHLTNSPITVEPGTLRAIPLPAERVAQLSESARRFMAPLNAAPTPH